MLHRMPETGFGSPLWTSYQRAYGRCFQRQAGTEVAQTIINLHMDKYCQKYETEEQGWSIGGWETKQQIMIYNVITIRLVVSVADLLWCV